ncbi:hypothetical protein [Actinomadura algeriensis]|uniref:ABC transporter permease n=1 Tax=Actinomadura algeriensis TaxID=1679523 RepID=A0ABR9JVU8_9ACTN|nr:hypothetical protein [Actinomadura algeriensis]MBE1534697.1 hypothetical protein [Actinomadura algeriensis]
MNETVTQPTKAGNKWSGKDARAAAGKLDTDRMLTEIPQFMADLSATLRKKAAGAFFACVLAPAIVGVVLDFVWLYVDLGEPDDGWPGPDGPRTVNTLSTIYQSPFPSSGP